MNTLVVGDLHGKVAVAEAVLGLVDANKIIFIGDYLDSYEGNVNDQIKLLDLVLDACEKYPGHVYALLGNHELSYLQPRYVCSGWKQSTQYAVDERTERMQKLLVPVVQHEAGWLLTHAGVSKQWANQFSWPPEEAVQKCPEDKLFQIGRARGGIANCGGPLWCDYYDEFLPIPGLKQIFGHTARTESIAGIRTEDGENYCIDCLDRVPEILRIKDDGRIDYLML